MWLDLSKWAQDVKILKSYVNAQRKVISAEEELSNQVDRITCSLDKHPLSLVISAITQWAHGRSNAGDLASFFLPGRPTSCWSTYHQNIHSFCLCLAPAPPHPTGHLHPLCAVR